MEKFKLVIGVLTAHHPSRWHRRQILRAQCFRDCPVPYKFVFGDPPQPNDWNLTGMEDEEILHSPGSDAKKFLHLKDKSFFRWALDQGATHSLRIMDDTWVFVDRVLKAGLSPYDLAAAFPCTFKLGGTFSFPLLRLAYPHGGCGIWLSRKAMQMIVDTPWDEHYLDSWPDEIDVGFGIKYKLPDKWLWDDFFIGEVLQGCLPYDHPLRSQPWEAYSANGISVYSDEMLFWNDEPERPLCIHDPGVHKINSPEMDALMEQAKQHGIAQAEAARAQESTHV